jgi:hypothetical protein
MEDNKYKQYWDFYVIFLILYVALVVPYRLGFESDDTPGWIVWGYFLDFSFLIDIILTFFTSFYDQELSEHVCDHRRIAAEYMRLWFWIDMFSILPIELILNSSLSGGDDDDGPGKFNVLAKFPRIARLYSLVKFIRLTKLTRLMKKKRSRRNMESKLKLREGL